MDETAALIPGDSSPKQERRVIKLTDQLAQQYGIEPAELIRTLKTNIIAVGQGPEATNAELFHVLTVMNKYGLDPWVKQLYAFRHDGKLNVAVGYDGWVSIANRHGGFQGVAYEYPAMSEMVKTAGGLMCWPWVKATAHVAGRASTDVYAWLDEWYVKGKSRPSNWDKYPRRRLQMKAYTLAVREALGIALYDDADMEQFRNMTPNVMVQTATEQKSMELMDKMDELPAIEQAQDELDWLGDDDENS